MPPASRILAWVTEAEPPSSSAIAQAAPQRPISIAASGGYAGARQASSSPARNHGARPTEGVTMGHRSRALAAALLATLLAALPLEARGLRKSCEEFLDARRRELHTPRGPKEGR